MQSTTILQKKMYVKEGNMHFMFYSAKICSIQFINVCDTVSSAISKCHTLYLLFLKAKSISMKCNKFKSRNSKLPLVHQI